MTCRKFAAIFAVLTSSVICRLQADERADVSKGRAGRSRLESVQWVVGSWRGVGQPRRGSRQDAWREDCVWTWKFEDGGDASLSVRAENGKYVTSGELRPTGAPQELAFEVRSLDAEKASSQVFHGKLDDAGRLVLIDSEAPPDSLARITIRAAAGGDRLLVLYEKKLQGDRFNRIAEVGYTREGSGFGKGSSSIECVVTGGLGTIPVTYNGNTYYVCCTGCRDYFYDNPAEVLKEYQDRKSQ